MKEDKFWCDHMEYKESQSGKHGWFFGEWMRPNWSYCPICGTPKPDKLFIR